MPVRQYSFNSRNIIKWYYNFDIIEKQKLQNTVLSMKSFYTPNIAFSHICRPVKWRHLLLTFLVVAFWNKICATMWHSVRICLPQNFFSPVLHSWIFQLKERAFYHTCQWKCHQKWYCTWHQIWHWTWHQPWHMKWRQTTLTPDVTLEGTLHIHIA